MRNIGKLCPCEKYHPAGLTCAKENPLNKPDKTYNHMILRSEPVDLSSSDATAAMQSLYHINDMCCPVEETLIIKKLSNISGVLNLEFNLMQRTLRVKHNPSALSDISKVLVSLNIGAKQIDTKTYKIKTVSIPEPKVPWGKLILAGLFAALSEIFELILEWHVVPFGINLDIWKISTYTVIEYIPLFFAVIAILLIGLDTYKKGWVAVRNLNLSINALMSMSVTGAVIIGQYPEAAMVMVLFNLSEIIEAKTLDRTRNAIRNLLSLSPEKAIVLQADGAWVEQDACRITVGSRIRVRPGEHIALDGIIVQGNSSVNQAPITGESMPVEKTVGDVVYAGTINESGSFELKVTAVASNSTFTRIIHSVEEAQSTRAPMQRFIDQFARYYTPVVLIVAILTGTIYPLFLGGIWVEHIYTALVILLIGCPCALVISTPVTIIAGMTTAARYGILVKGGVFLEQGRLLNWIAMDKTGTVTHGKPCQTDFIGLNNVNDRRTISLASSLAKHSDHPVSKAITEDAAKKNVPLLDVYNFTAIPGRGVSGDINGIKWYLGNCCMIEELKKCTLDLKEQISGLEQQGKTVVALIGEKVLGLFVVADTLKNSSIEAVKELKKLGVKTIMLTGDNEHISENIAVQIGVDSFKANLLPEDKLKIITELKNSDKVGMVGDGINDAPALAKADIGFSMAGNGTDIAIETADVALMDDDLRKIPRFIRLSRATYAILIQNIILVLGIKATFFILTFTGLTTMWMAVFADVGTGLLVIANGLRVK